MEKFNSLKSIIEYDFNGDFEEYQKTLEEIVMNKKIIKMEDVARLDAFKFDASLPENMWTLAEVFNRNKISSDNDANIRFITHILSSTEYNDRLKIMYVLGDGIKPSSFAYEELQAILNLKVPTNFFPPHRASYKRLLINVNELIKRHDHDATSNYAKEIYTILRYPRQDKTHTDAPRLYFELLFYAYVRVDGRSSEFMEEFRKLCVTYHDRNALNEILSSRWFDKMLLYLNTPLEKRLNPILRKLYQNICDIEIKGETLYDRYKKWKEDNDKKQ
jgi:hypothetical protein